MCYKPSRDFMVFVFPFPVFVALLKTKYFFLWDIKYFFLH
jgi:hypothetical protein